MKKFTTDYVNQIAINLRDRYKQGFPILKELVQNADDAKATTLVFGYHAGLPKDADNPLLHGPAIWVLNNGGFKTEDGEAIASFGLNAKAAESGTIGKFGLGMKSVFHLCEAFFYVAHDGASTFYEVLSPWFRDSNKDTLELHRSWGKIKKRDEAALDKVVDAAIKTHPEFAGHQKNLSWFLLWIPLRRREHVPLLDTPTAPIVERYPGDAGNDSIVDLDFLNDKNIPQLIAYLLPLLRYLEQVSFAGTAHQAPFLLRLRSEQNTQRLDHQSAQLRLQGWIEENKQSKSTALQFAVVQATTDAPCFAELQQAEAWPKSMAIVKGHRQPIPDKAQPEGAVLISHATKRQGRLVIQWAVFLPTEEKQWMDEVEIPNSSTEIRIVLHGQFFVDSGRRGIDGMDTLQATSEVAASGKRSDTELPIQWNRLLAQQLVLPMLLPALAEYVEQQRFKFDEIKALVTALHQSQLFKQFASFVCANSVYVCQLTEKGPCWTLHPSQPSLRLLPLPLPKNKEHTRPWDVLPKLHRISDAIFVDKDTPYLAPALTTWDEALLCQVLDGLKVETITHQTFLAYLVDFLHAEQHRFLDTHAVQTQLVTSLRRVLCDCTLSSLRKNSELFKKLIAVLKPEHVFGLGTVKTNVQNSLPEPIWQKLIAIETTVLLLPADLTSAENVQQTATPDASVIEQWLEVLDARQWPEEQAMSCLAAAEALLDTLPKPAQKTSPPEQYHLLARHPEWAVVKVWNAQRKKDTACSLDDITKAERQCFLFKRANPTDKDDEISILAQALPEVQPLVFVNNKTASWMVERYDTLPVSNDISAVLTSIGAAAEAPTLSSDLKHIKALLEKVGKADTKEPSIVRGIRYLLHQDATHFKDGETCLWQDPQQGKSPWVKLWHMNLPTDKKWTVLDSEWVGCIAPKQYESLHIKSVEKDTVIQQLRVEPHFSSMDATQLTVQDIDTLLGEFPDEKLWRKLPLHRDQHGRYGKLGPDAFFGNEPLLPAGIGDTLRFIQASTDKRHLEQQKAQIMVWNANTAIENVLTSETPQAHWRYVFEHCPETLEGDACDAMKEMSWLPLENGMCVGLRQLFSIKGLDDSLQKLTQIPHAKYFTLGDVAEDVKSHEKFKTVVLPHVSRGKDALSPLAEVMQGNKLVIGQHTTDDDKQLKQSINTLAELGSVLPAWTWIHKITAALPEHWPDIVEKLLLPLRQPLSTDLCEQVLQHIADQATPSTPEKWRDVFVQYLQEWVNSDSPSALKQRLPKLRLFTTDNRFAPPNSLVCGVYGVKQTSEVHPKVADVLKDLIHRNDHQKPDDISKEPSSCTYTPVGALPNALERWAQAWEQTSVAPAVGALMGVFGKETRDIAREWLKPIDYDNDYLVEGLNWKEARTRTPNDRWVFGVGSAQARLAVMRPRLKILQTGDQVATTNLIGQTISVDLRTLETADTLLAGPVTWVSAYEFEVTLRSVEAVQNMSPREQKLLLKATAEQLFSELYGEQEADFNALWEKFDRTDQLQLETAASLILDGLPQLLEQLDEAKKNPKIKKALKAYDQARREVAAANVAKNTKKTAAEEKKQEKLCALNQLLTTDAEAQEALLRGMRKRIQQNQYESSSIPFELLQNADDAVGEYQEMSIEKKRVIGKPEEIGRFVVCADATKKTLLLLHWGRPINYTGHSIDPNSDNPDYEKDLEHMLMLGASGKSGHSDTTTGKFGLGFKSVLLAADAPIVSSGDLQFAIKAGCLPVQHTHSDWVEDKKKSHQGTSRLRCTAVELSGLLEETDQVLHRFEQLAGLCTVFLRHIRHIEIETDSVQTSHQWKPTVLLDTPRAWCETGQVQLPFSHPKKGLHGTATYTATTDVLVLRRGRCKDDVSDGAVLIPLKNGRVQPFKDNLIPAIWVNAPTKGTEARGFLLNAAFEIDTGRGSLAQSIEGKKRNEETAKTLADELSPLMEQWFKDTRQHWADWQQKWKACWNAPTPADFWQDWWQTLMEPEPSQDASPDAKLADAFACRLFDRFVERTECVPNGLSGADIALVPIQSLKVVVNPSPQSHHRAVLPHLKEWPRFQQNHPLKSWCSHDVAHWLKRANRELKNLKELSRDLVLDVLGHPRRLLAKDVHHLHVIVQKWPEHGNKKESWKEKLKDIQLQNKQGEWKPLNAFCSWKVKDDPLADFAPNNVILDASYQEQEDWDVFSSQNLPLPKPSDSDIAHWCIQAASDEEKKAVLDWLLRKNFHDAIWERLKYLSSWMKELNKNHPLLDTYSDKEKTHLLNSLDLLKDTLNTSLENTTPSNGLTLKAVHQWWQAERLNYIDEYDASFWPPEIDRQTLHDVPIDRSVWMALFTLAVARRFGRSKDEQHRGFVQFLTRRGWWDTIAFVDPHDDAQSWMNILHEYAEGTQFEAQFEMWMDSFPRLYRLARWCDEYAELFCGLDRRSPAEAAHLLTPASDASLSGSGFDAPTLHRTLKSGYPLVVRELLRAGVLHSPVAQGMAYTPSQSVRGFLNELIQNGADFSDDDLSKSEQIFEAISRELNAEDATFFGDYDIPLIVLSKDKELQKRVAQEYGDGQSMDMDGDEMWGDNA